MRKSPKCCGNTPELFWARVQVGAPDECWSWLGGRHNGYGALKYRGKSVRAHRVALRHTGVFVPDGMDVLHSCDNPPCCNPAHLRVGNDRDNALDRESRGRGRQPKGEAQGQSKLTTEQVREIRVMLATGRLQKDIARRYPVSAALISQIARGKAWRHVC